MTTTNLSRSSHHDHAYTVPTWSELLQLKMQLLLSIYTIWDQNGEEKDLIES